MADLGETIQDRGRDEEAPRRPSSMPARGAAGAGRCGDVRARRDE